MKLCVKLILAKKEMNSDWRRAMLSLIKHLLQSEAPQLYEEYYGEYKTTMKKFNYSLVLPGAKFADDRIMLNSDEIYLYISSSEKLIMMYFQNALLKKRGKSFPLQHENSMKIDSVRITKTPDITDSEIIVKMLSPLVVREHSKDNKDKYYYYDEEGFLETLQRTLARQLGDTEKVPVVEPVKAKRVVVKAFGGNISCNLGIFKITGEPSQLEQLYLNGLGSKSSAGFGAFEIIG